MSWTNGTVSTYITLDPSAPCTAPIAVGVEFQNLNMTSLPGPDNVTNPETPGCSNDPFAAGCAPPFDELILPFPGSNSSFSPYTFMQLDWNPIGKFHLLVGMSIILFSSQGGVLMVLV